jgi:hypothetical protein
MLNHSDFITEGVDFTVDRVYYDNKGNRGGKIYEDIIKLTPDAFKQLCQSTRTKNGKLVRSYFIKLENLVMKYHHFIKDGLREQLGIVNRNKKHLKKAKGGLIYILKAGDNPSVKDVYKFGRAEDLKKRIAAYNTGCINDIEILFIYQVNDPKKCENALKIS